MGWALQDARSVWGMGGGGESNGIREEGWVSPTAATAHLMLVVVRRV